MVRQRIHTVSRVAGLFGAGLVLLPAVALAGPDEDLVTALTKRDLAAVEREIGEGADINLAGAGGRTALMLAASENRSDLVRHLLAAGARVNATNSRGGTALMYAAVGGDSETVAVLLANRADVNAAGSNGWTALMIAAASGYPEIAQRLLERGADPNAADIYGWTPLMRAVYEQRDAVVQVLLRNGKTNVNATNDQGHTALHHAAMQGHADLARLLLAHGADRGRRDAEGRTPSTLASLQGKREIVDLIAGGH